LAGKDGADKYRGESRLVWARKQNPSQWPLGTHKEKTIKK